MKKILKTQKAQDNRLKIFQEKCFQFFAGVVDELYTGQDGDDPMTLSEVITHVGNVFYDGAKATNGTKRENLSEY